MSEAKMKINQIIMVQKESIAKYYYYYKKLNESVDFVDGAAKVLKNVRVYTDKISIFFGQNLP